MDGFFPGYAQMFTRIGRERGWGPVTRAQFDAQSGPTGALMVGGPEEVAAKILRHWEALGGVSRVTLQMDNADLPHAKLMRRLNCSEPASRLSSSNSLFWKGHLKHMADKTARNGIILIGASAAALGYFLWKSPSGRKRRADFHNSADRHSAHRNSAQRGDDRTEKKTTMTHILHLDSSARGSGSHSRTVSGELVAATESRRPQPHRHLPRSRPRSGSLRLRGVHLCHVHAR